MKMKNKKCMKKWSITKIIFFIGILVYSTSCERSQNTAITDEDPVIAEVDPFILKKSDLKFLSNNLGNSEDSLNVIKMYVETWVRQQLMVKEALKNIPIDEAELNRKVQDYKNSLLVYEFEKNHIDKTLGELNTEEIEDYYNKNKGNLRLKETIVKVQFVKLEKRNKSNATIERAFNSNNQEKIREIALQDASTFYLEDSTWVRFEDVIISTPFASNKNQINLKSNKLMKDSDNNFNYYLYVKDHRLRGEVPPLEFVREEVIKIVKNKKRTALALELQQQIYNRALENNEFKIYEY
jgi:hypothetical protein